MGERPRPLPRRRRPGPPELAPAWQQLETERPPTGSLPLAPVLPRRSYGGLSESEFRNEAYRGTGRELMANEFNRPPEMYRGERVLGPFLELTGAPSLVRSYARARDGDPLGSAGEAAMGALAIGGVRGAMRAPIPAARPAPPIATPWPDDMFGALPREPLPRPPSPEARLPGRASDGSVLPVAPTRPFTNSLRGGSDDLRDAAVMRSAEDAYIARSTRGNDYYPTSDEYWAAEWGDTGMRGVDAPMVPANTPLADVSTPRPPRVRLRGEDLGSPSDYIRTDANGSWTDSTWARFYLQKHGGNVEAAIAEANARGRDISARMLEHWRRAGRIEVFRGPQ